MTKTDLICNDCDFLKYSEGENSWQDSTGCYKWKEPVDNKCNEKVKSLDLGQMMGDK